MEYEIRSAELSRTETDLIIARERVVQSMHALHAEVMRRSHVLRDEVSSLTDWREWVRRRPGTFVLTAFAVGYFVGNRH